MQRKVGKEKPKASLRKLPVLLIIGAHVFSFFLSACTTDPVQDEEFEAPTGKFPLLGNVPDPPVFETPKSMDNQQKRLQQEHDEAIHKQAEVMESIKP